MAATFQLEIPIADYRELIALCDPESRDYRNFHNGIIEDQVVKILCPEGIANELYDYAVRKYPTAAKHIKSMALSALKAPPNPHYA